VVVINFIIFSRRVKGLPVDKSKASGGPYFGDGNTPLPLLTEMMTGGVAKHRLKFVY
jgi:hypothetical protein